MSSQKQEGLSFATLRAAEAVIETKSLTGAALKLGISQPAISMHLGRLERTIGTSLIKKVGNKIIIKEEISRLIRQMLDLERRLKTVGYEKNISKLKVGICTYCAPLLLERVGALGKLKETLAWRIADSRRLEEMYEQGSWMPFSAPCIPRRSRPTFRRSFPFAGSARSSFWISRSMMATGSRLFCHPPIRRLAPWRGIGCAGTRLLTMWWARWTTS